MNAARQIKQKLDYSRRSSYKRNSDTSTSFNMSSGDTKKNTEREKISGNSTMKGRSNNKGNNQINTNNMDKVSNNNQPKRQETHLKRNSSPTQNPAPTISTIACDTVMDIIRKMRQEHWSKIDSVFRKLTNEKFITFNVLRTHIISIIRDIYGVKRSKKMLSYIDPKEDEGVIKLAKILLNLYQEASNESEAIEVYNNSLPEYKTPAKERSDKMPPLKLKTCEACKVLKGNNVNPKKNQNPKAVDNMKPSNNTQKLKSETITKKVQIKGHSCIQDNAKKILERNISSVRPNTSPEIFRGKKCIEILSDTSILESKGKEKCTEDNEELVIVKSEIKENRVEPTMLSRIGGLNNMRMEKTNYIISLESSLVDLFSKPPDITGAGMQHLNTYHEQLEDTTKEYFNTSLNLFWLNDALERGKGCGDEGKTLGSDKSGSSQETANLKDSFANR